MSAVTHALDQAQKRYAKAVEAGRSRDAMEASRRVDELREAAEVEAAIARKRDEREAQAAAARAAKVAEKEREIAIAATDEAARAIIAAEEEMGRAAAAVHPHFAKVKALIIEHERLQGIARGNVLVPMLGFTVSAAFREAADSRHEAALELRDLVNTLCAHAPI